MPRKRKAAPAEQAIINEKEYVKVGGFDFDDAFDALETDVRVKANTLPPEGVEDDDKEDSPDAEIDERFRGTPAFISLQRELADIREARRKLSIDMEAPELDRDERDTLKARGTLLDSRERSAREELKLFHKNELTQLGQIRKVRIIVEDLLDDNGKVFEGYV